MNSHAAGIAEIPFQYFFCPHGHIANIQSADLAVNRFTPFAAPWRLASTAINRNIKITLIGNITAELPITAETCIIEYGAAPWLAIYVKEHRVFLSRIKILWLGNPAIECNTVLGGYFEKGSHSFF